MKTRIFLDSGDVSETREAISLLGFLDGQTTNPTLIAKNPLIEKRLKKGEKFQSATEIFDFYKSVVQEISKMIPDGSVSIEVYADSTTSAEEMMYQARNMWKWISNAHIKLPLTQSGLEAAKKATAEGMRVNMTLCFSQEQAAAVHAATKNAPRGTVFVSPFVGRLDDRGENGMSLISNILKVYKVQNSHVEVLTASVRSLDHFLAALSLKSDIITAPLKVLKEWGSLGMPMPKKKYVYPAKNLSAIPYKTLDLNQLWSSFELEHELTTKGIEKFADDWNMLMD